MAVRSLAKINHRPRKDDADKAETELASFIDKFDTSTATLIRKCRAEMRKRLPAAIELVYDNYNFFVIGYAATERTADCIVSIAAAANGVSLMFYQGAHLSDPDGLLQGSGTQNRFLRVPILATLRSPAVVELIQRAAVFGKTPLAANRRGYLLIKSVSAKQRPRQKPR